jgi:thioredoxin reductase
MTAAPDTDLLVVGAGPAGCAAVVMAESLGVSTILLDPAAICTKIASIPVLDNVLGGYATGAALAEKATCDVQRAKLCTLRLGERVAEVSVSMRANHVTALLDSGEALTARGLVVATGVAPAEAVGSNWISLGSGAVVPQLTALEPSELDHRSILVLGADRPLGTLLRAHPQLNVRITVAHPRSDHYKTDEVRADPRVTLVPTRHVTLTKHVGAIATAAIDGAVSGPHDLIAANIGTTPVTPAGPLVRDDLGYCPADLQDQRIHVAGDLRGARNQRIMTAMGSGAEAALRFYYRERRA